MRVLLIVPDWSVKGVSGGISLEQEILRSLAEIAPVDVLAVQDGGMSGIIRDLEGTNGQLYFVTRSHTPALQKVFGRLPSIALWSRGENAPQIVADIIRRNRVTHLLVSRTYSGINVGDIGGARLIIIAQNVEHQRLQYLGSRGPEAFRRWWIRLQARRMERLERNVLSRADVILSVSPTECSYLAARVPRGTRVLQICPPPEGELMNVPTEPRPAQTVLFVGSLSYQPNREAVIRIIDDILPRIRQTHPHTRLLIAGSHPAGLRSRIATVAGAELQADFTEPELVFSQATAFVAPLPQQSGLSMKTLNALASGTPVVATPPVLASLGAEGNIHALVASHPEEFATQVRRLWDDPSLRTKLARAGRELVSSRFTRLGLSTSLREAIS